MTPALLKEIADLYDLGYQNGWHNVCFSDAIRVKVRRWGGDPAKLEVILWSLCDKRRAAVRTPKGEYFGKSE